MKRYTIIFNQWEIKEKLNGLNFEPSENHMHISTCHMWQCHSDIGSFERLFELPPSMFSTANRKRDSNKMLSGRNVQAQMNHLTRTAPG